MTRNGSTRRDLLALERRLLEPRTRADPGRLRALLAEDFVEVASTRKRYARAQILEALRREPPTRFSLTGFRATLLTPECALTTYRLLRSRAGQAPVRSLRSSIWKRGKGGWRMAFHQGTPRC